MPEALDHTVDVAANLAAVRARILEAAAEAGRDPAAVTLIAVGKAQPLERLEAALEAGQRVFGENYVQEAQGRWPALRARYPEVELHLIGALQTNKAKDAVALFDVIQTVDRPRLAAALEKEMTKQGKALRCFVQVNTGKEPQKAGIMPEETEAFVRLCRESHGLDVRGLMAIPPADEDIALHTAFLVKLAERSGLEQVSIGMSDDYADAVRFGATHVRVGSAIFGARPPR
ncbi:MAG: YggS family pyridoxal phosphate-dependent enzyme [Geminicoccaceae bacterium]|jgi:pyridoxal phosphate enzyme (YggS family)|nr:YggS family pyridoxal phosphate-dependent enzyme [Geminicoccaceae bacterium]HRY24271.1 YggS family pyridoxal phosphate-dependent enzyme [Geminicoccaceae bacterium]